MGYEFRCELHRIGDHVELRVRYGNDEVVHAERTTGIEAARQVAQVWLRKAIDLQGAPQSS